MGMVVFVAHKDALTRATHSMLLVVFLQTLETREY